MKELQDIDLKAIIEAETGQKFNKENKINSPFTNEKTPSFSVYFNSNRNKWQFKDFSGSDKYGDALDFIMEYKNLSREEAREYLGMEVARTPIEEFKSIIEDYVSNQIKTGNKKGYKPLGTFVFVDKDNNPIYAKVKFLKPDGKKETPYYTINDGQVIKKRLYEEVPYNYYNLLQGIAHKKAIVFLEGEKDVNTINNTLNKKDFVATSLKGFKDYDKIKSEFMKIVIIGDTGKAGEKYIADIKDNFLKDSSSFKIINPPGLKSLGDNKDVTDWLENGHTKDELLRAFKRSLDLKDKSKLQQNADGIYSNYFDKKNDEYTKTYLTNFEILEASKGYNIDKDEEEIIIKVRSSRYHKTVEKIASGKIFNDLKSFKDFLGLEFTLHEDKMKCLNALKDWIMYYFVYEDKEIHEGSRFLPVGNEFNLVTSNGLLSSKGDICSTKLAKNNSIDIADIEEINGEELQELMKYLFNFLDYSQALNIIGSAISFMQVGQNIGIGGKLHHLCLFGEAQSGKSTILEKILVPLFNQDSDSIRGVSSSMASLRTLCSAGNYPLILDEYKPSEINKNKLQELGDFFRILYDRSTISRGQKDFSAKDFKLERPLVLAGEETFQNSSKSLMTRCCIITMAENQQTNETTKAVRFLENNEELLRKLGKSVILESLKMPIGEYKELRSTLNDKFNVKARPLNTCVNIACGIEVLNNLLIKHGLQPLEDYYKSIEANIRETVLEGADGARSAIERMIMLFNEVIQDSNYSFAQNAVKTKKDKTYIRSQSLVDVLHKYSKDYGSVDITMLKIKDFKTQAKKAGYISRMSAEKIYDSDTKTSQWYDEYDTAKLVALNVDSIIECDLMGEAVSIAEQNIFKIS